MPKESYIDKFYVAEEGHYKAEGAEGIKDPLGFIQSGIFEHCNCGMPDESLHFIRDALDFINSKPSSQGLSREEWSVLFGEYWKKKDKIFFTDGIFYFIMYELERLGFEEHGGTTPGWLTEDGKALLADLNRLLDKTS